MQDGAHLTLKKMTLSEMFYRSIPGRDSKISVNGTEWFSLPCEQGVNGLKVLLGLDFSFRLQTDTSSLASISKRSS